MTYNPIEFWKQEGKKYFKEFRHTNLFEYQEQNLISYLTTTTYFDSVLELGCGFGRITKLILDNFPNIEYTAIDISMDQLQIAKKIINNKTVNFIQTDIESLQLNKKYDLVIAVEVLMHQLPSDIRKLIDKMISLSRIHVINLDYYKKPKYQNFLHDYPTLYNNKADSLEIENQSLFHYKVK